MELRQLRYFIAVAERLSFSKAALHLHLTVPPLSRQVRQLEEELGVSLFVRDRRRVMLTDAGLQLLTEARLVVAQTERISNCVKLTQSGEVGSLKMGIGFGLGERISPVLVEYSKKFPRVEVHCRDLFSSSQIDALLDGEIDVGFLRPSPESADVASEFLFEERLMVHVSKANPLAKRKSLRVKDLAAEPLLMPTRAASSGLYDKTLEMYRAARLTPTVIDLPSDPPPHGDVQVLMLTCGKGIFIVPDEVAFHPPATSGIVAIPLEDPGARISVHVAWRKQEQSAVVHAFLNSVRRVLLCQTDGRPLAAAASAISAAR